MVSNFDNPDNQVKTPHVWYTRDGGGSDCRHLAMSREGAIQAHLMHYGVFSSDYFGDNIEAKDEGEISRYTNKDNICLEIHCVLYAWSSSKI